MIKVTRLDGSVMVINCDLVESVEKTPDTVVTLVNGHKLVVRESVEGLVDLVIEYRKKTHLCPLLREHIPTGLVHRPAENDLIERGL